MQTIKFVNALGAEVVFEHTAPFVFWKIEGCELPDVTKVASQAAGQNGYTLHSVLLEPRRIKITGHIHGKQGIEKMYELRRELNGVLSPLLGMGTFYYENDYGIWHIPAVCEGLPYVSKIRNVQTLTIELECPSPFWLSEKESEVPLAYIEGGIQFPVNTPAFFGKLGYRARVENDSDGITPLEITIEGSSENPVITNNTTGEFIKVSKHMQSYDKLYINTDPEKLEVSLITIAHDSNKRIKSNAYGYLSYDSKLFGLVPGVNDLEFYSDEENKKLKIMLRFYKRFAGV